MSTTTMAVTADGDFKALNAAEVAAPFKAELIATIKQQRIVTKLVGFLANKDPSAKEYADWTARSCKQIGIEFELREVFREHLEDLVIAANNDPAINGIIVYYPVFGGGHDQYIQNCVSPYKDVEGLCHTYRYSMYHNIRMINKEKTLKCIIPCTPLAIVKILEFCKLYDSDIPYGNQLHGKTVTIINRSEVVGRPLAALLANDGARVYSVDLYDILVFSRGTELSKHVVADTDEKLEDFLSKSDVVVTGVPSKDYKVPTNLLKPGVVAINFSSEKNFDEEAIKSVASIYVARIGQVTVTMLQRNLLRLRKHQQKMGNKNIFEL